MRIFNALDDLKFATLYHISVTVLYLIQVAYLSISTFTGAPCEEPNLLLECRVSGEYNLVTLFNILNIITLSKY